MGLYENGIDTRKAILNVCNTLFFEKGYRATSMDDICQAAHVNRGSIYYHFKDKENIRYEVLWGKIIECIEQVRTSGQGIPARYEALLAIYVLLEKICTDGTVRRFFVEYFTNYPVYSPKDNLSRAVITILNQINRQILPAYEMDRLGKASTYGFVMSLIILTQKQEYKAEKLFQQIFFISNLIRGVPREEIGKEWEIVQGLILKISG